MIHEAEAQVATQPPIPAAEEFPVDPHPEDNQRLIYEEWVRENLI